MTIVRSIMLVCIAITLLSASLAIAAEETHHPAIVAGQGIPISSELKDLLNQEMAAIQEGMMALIPAMAAGDWVEIETIGKHVKASFIMKQKLTKSQKKELHRILPPAFIAMDRSFHKSAGMLAHAAKQGNADVVGFYFSKLNTACVACHSRFAAGRFPGLVTQNGKEGQH